MESWFQGGLHIGLYGGYQCKLQRRVLFPVELGDVAEWMSSKTGRHLSVGLMFRTMWEWRTMNIDD